MKKLFKTLLLLASLIGFAACQPDEPTKPVIADEGSSDQELRPRARLNSGQVQPNSFVSSKDIYAFIERDCPATKGIQPSQASVVPYVGEDRLDTLMYIVNYPGNAGWKVLSADSRTPAVIAEGYSGSFSLDEADGAVAAWMSCVATDMARVRHATDSELSFSEIDIACNKAFWSKTPTRLHPDDPIGEQGYWDEIVTSQTEFVDSIGHMTPEWDQEMPYNQYCPIKTNGPQGHAYAGCVAVAGANTLYYLHNKLGVPSSMVSQAAYDSNNNEWIFSMPSETIWAAMDTTSLPINSYNRPEAIMIGYIGKTINMHYGSEYSWAIPANLRTNLFNPAGISCSHGDYDEEVVANSLLNLLPVIITASDQLFPINGRIHSFVADAYKRTRQKYIHTHHWVGPIPQPDPGESSFIVEPGEYDDYTTYSYSYPEVTRIKFNWGWWSQWGDDHLNDGWYTLTGGWTVINGGTYDYNHNCQMIYGFCVSQ